METFLLFVAFAQSFGISLGVGASTLAIVNYIVALRDRDIDTSERVIMGVGYTFLRISMGIILVTLFLQAMFLIPQYGLDYFRPFIFAAWLLVIVLFVNAVLMTKHLMPSFIGPSLQAATWYGLATMYFLSTVNLTNLPFTTYIVGYLTLIVVMTIVVNVAITLTAKNTKGNKGDSLSK